MKKEARKLNAYVISTSGKNGDFVSKRKRIFETIEKLDMKPMGYELYDYASVFGENISGNCLKNMQAADVFLIFINKRYGFIESDKSESVTHIEINYARKSDKPCLTFIDKELLELYESALACKEKREELLSEFFGNDSSSGEKLLALVGEIYNARSGNLLIPYEDGADNMITLVESKIVAMAPEFISKFVKRQREVALGIRSDNPLASSDFGVPISYKTYRDDSNSSSLTDSVKKNLSEGAVIIEGESGSGKSYSLLSSLRSVSDDFISNKAWSEEKIPLLLRFGEFKDERFDLWSYIYSMYAELLSYRPPNFVVERFLRQGVVIFADGLDEWQHASSLSDICGVIRAFGYNFLLSVRSTVYKRISVSIFGLGIPCKVITVFGWNTCALREYAVRCLDDVNRAERLMTLMGNCENKSYITSNGCTEKCYSPLISCMAIRCAASNDAMHGQVYNTGTIFRNAASSCLIRNMQKRGIVPTEENLDEAKTYLINVSRFVFTAPSHELDPTSRRDLDDYLESIGCTADNERQKLYLSTFFTVQGNYFYPKHMMVVYYYVAEAALRLLRDGNYGFFSEYNIPSEVNRMLGDFYAEIPCSELVKSFNGLCKYAETLQNESSKLLIMYFIPRLALSSKTVKPAVVDFLRQQSKAVKSFSLIAILNWLTQLGDVEAAERYFELINGDIEFSKYNRGSYLIYQGDRPDKVHGFDDSDGNPEWEATARSFIEHLDSNEIRHSFIRRVDFAIIISFIKNGKRIYPFFKEYFEKMTEEHLMDITFTDKYVKSLRDAGFDESALRKSLSELLLVIKNELRIS